VEDSPSLIAPGITRQGRLCQDYQSDGSTSPSQANYMIPKPKLGFGKIGKHSSMRHQLTLQLTMVSQGRYHEAKRKPQ